MPILPPPDFVSEVAALCIDELDPSGAWVLQRTVERWTQSELATTFSGTTESFQILIEEVERSSHLKNLQRNPKARPSCLLMEPPRHWAGYGGTRG